MITVIQDFETCNPYCDLPVVGSWVYAGHWATEILCLVYSVSGAYTDPGSLWAPGDPNDREDALMALSRDPDALFVCHGTFEKDIWRHIMVPRYGFPDIPNERWHDIQSVCALKAVPLSLEKALPPLCGREKDTEGSKLTISLSRFGGRLWREGQGHPKNKSRKDIPHAPRSIETMARVFTYCHQDVADETALHNRLGLLPDAERRVWLLDQVINERGVALDRQFISGARRIVADARGPLENEFRLLTGGIGPGQTAKVIEWVAAQGVGLCNLQKATIAELLGVTEDEDNEDVRGLSALGTLPGNVRRALAIRSLVGSASIRKLSRMEECIADDGRVHRLLQYHGTGPGRWAGRLFNPLNFPRGTAVGGDTHKPLDPEALATAIITGDVNAVCDLGMVVEDPPLSGAWRPADPIESVSSALRHAIIAAPGRHLVVGDFVQAQARIDLALAGQTDFLEKLAAGMDPYLLTAEGIFNDPPGSLTKADAGKRQYGKNTFLGCGFQMGWKKFHEKYCPDQTEEFAQQAIDAYRKKLAPKVPKLWAALQNAALYAVWDKRPQEAYGIRYELEDGWLTARLLDGKKIYYWNPQRAKKMLPWMDEPQDCWTYDTVRGGRLLRTYAYGGLLTENVVMGLERQLLVRAMLRCEAENLPVIFNGYDEIVCETPERFADWTRLQHIMEDRPEWAATRKLPIAAEGWTGGRYKKG
jgi:DNA polymerase bacteriophage-type